MELHWKGSARSACGCLLLDGLAPLVADPPNGTPPQGKIRLSKINLFSGDKNQVKKMRKNNLRQKNLKHSYNQVKRVNFCLFWILVVLTKYNL